MKIRKQKDTADLDMDDEGGSVIGSTLKRRILLNLTEE
jgi:hypothetical protein